MGGLIILARILSLGVKVKENLFLILENRKRAIFPPVLPAVSPGSAVEGVKGPHHPPPWWGIVTLHCPGISAMVATLPQVQPAPWCFSAIVLRAAQLYYARNVAQKPTVVP